MKDGDTIAIWFSCGAASAVAAKKTIEEFGKDFNIRVVNNPVAEEDPDNRRFLKDVESWIGRPIETAINAKYPNASAVEVWEERKYMSGIYGAPCTLELKKNARYQWEVNNKPDWHVLGFTAEEQQRHNRFVLSERENVIPTLINNGIQKTGCFKTIQKAGIDLPQVYHQGYPNANCLGCVKATSPTYWNHVRVVHPETFNLRAEQSRRLGVRLVRYKGKRIFLDELPIGAVGRSMKSMSVECGIFCEEKFRPTNQTKGGEE